MRGSSSALTPNASISSGDQVSALVSDRLRWVGAVHEGVIRRCCSRPAT